MSFHVRWLVMVGLRFLSVCLKRAGSYTSMRLSEHFSISLHGISCRYFGSGLPKDLVRTLGKPNIKKSPFPWMKMFRKVDMKNTGS